MEQFSVFRRNQRAREPTIPDKLAGDQAAAGGEI
jgi:hypothetical protein